MSDSQWVEDQRATLQLLQAMYPLSDELQLSSGAQNFLEEDLDTRNFDYNSFTFTLNLSEAEGGESSSTIPLQITIGLTRPGCDVYLQQSDSLNRSQQENLNSDIPPFNLETHISTSEYILEVVDSIKLGITTILSVQAKETASGANGELSTTEVKNEVKNEGKLERVWFWFPSLSSREKRKDLVTYAQESDLTGFVLAGKPGLLCVEGIGMEIDKYMARIKSDSWSDIPSYQKKVTERSRIPLSSSNDKNLKDMKDITDIIPKYGQYSHRAEMSEVKKIMQDWGLEGEFSNVIMGGNG